MVSYCMNPKVSKPKRMQNNLTNIPPYIQQLRKVIYPYINLDYIQQLQQYIPIEFNLQQILITTIRKLMNHPTFSLQNILNEPLSPDLCKRILDQIKSPLMEQSFEMTNDESFSNSFTHHPKRPDIPPLSPNHKYTRPPAIKNKANTYPYGRSFYDQLGYNSYNRNKQPPHTTDDLKFAEGFTQRYESQFINSKIDKQIHHQDLIQIQSVVSPLDPNITLKKHTQNNFIDNIWTHFCGNVHNQAQEHQINYNDTKSKFPRKRIFNQKGMAVLENTKPKKYTHRQIESILLINEQEKNSHISIQNGNQPEVIQKSESEVLEQLRRNRHFEIASFVRFMLHVTTKLQAAEKERLFLEENIEILFQLASSEHSALESWRLDNENCDKFFNRMNCSSVSQIVQKISRNRLLHHHKLDIKQYNKQKNQVADSLQKMLQAFSEIQTLIQQFVNEPDCITKLKTVYSVLNDKFTSVSTKNTHQQINNLLNDLRLFKYQTKTYELAYLWDTFETDLLSQSQFIRGIVKTNGQYQSYPVSKDQDQFVSELSKMGYVKN